MGVGNCKRGGLYEQSQHYKRDMRGVFGRGERRARGGGGGRGGWRQRVEGVTKEGAGVARKGVQSG